LRTSIRRIAFSALLPFVWSISASECPSSAPLYPGPKISLEQYRSLTASLKGLSGFKCDQFGPKQLRCGSDSAPEIWWLTEIGHPAYPAVSRGEMLTDPKTRETCLVRDGYYAGAEEPFAEWMHELKRFDELTSQRFKASQ
jgi:hypothetical protein